MYCESELGKAIRPVEYAKAKQRSLEFPLAKGATLKKLYVGNLPFQATEQDISNWFTQAGATVANVALVTDKFTGQPRGFAFVEINNDEEAARIIQALNGQDFMGRNVVVNEARPREGGGAGRGGYGGGRGRDGGRGGDRVGAVVAEDATKRPCSPSSAPYAKAVAGHPHSYCLVLGASASEIAHPLCSNHSPQASAAQSSRPHRKFDTAVRPAPETISQASRCLEPCGRSRLLKRNNGEVRCVFRYDLGTNSSALAKRGVYRQQASDLPKL